jgi:hypothetical protein
VVGLRSVLPLNTTMLVTCARVRCLARKLRGRSARSVRSVEACLVIIDHGHQVIKGSPIVCVEDLLDALEFRP